MRLLANENFPFDAIEALRARGHDVAWVRADAPGIREIESAKRDPKRDVETLEMLCAALEREAPKCRSPKIRRKPAKR